MSKEATPPRITRLAEYAPPAFLIDSVELDFTLDETDTTVTARLAMRRNPAVPGDGPLVLDGARNEAGSGELLAIAVNGETLPSSAYALDESSLTVLKPASSFVLTTTRKLNPKANAALEGVYASGSGLFTQCEAEGFRRITWFLDRPDVQSTYRVTLRANKRKFPILLSNGNKVSEHDEGETRVAVWNDPWRKPCYLFALVAANLVARTDSFTTRSGKKVELNVWVQKQDLDQTEHCMDSLKRSMTWDEQRFGREYDLEVFNLVAVSDFNMGAMENKGLNIFNTKYVLARPDTATDVDFSGIEAVVGHEYFHNWSGNRVTCRDWFQLSLKEGFTVFRDQEFSSDVGSRAVRRIEAVRKLRSLQFAEDGGPTSHPVRPESYVEISNFYTLTIYEKGAEVVRVYHTLLGEETFRRGTDLYFSRHDGQAATVDDFARCMSEVSGRDLTQFKLWYSQSGTPEISSKGRWDAANGTFTITLAQTLPPTPGQPEKAPMLIPVKAALLGRDGKRLSLVVDGKASGTEAILELSRARQDFVFSGLSEEPVPALLREFSAPVKLTTDDTEAHLLFRLAHDDDAFNRVEAGQELFLRHLEAAARAVQAGQGAPAPSTALVDAVRVSLRSGLQPASDTALLALALSVPGIDLIGDRLVDRGGWADYRSSYTAREALITALARSLSEELDAVDAHLSKALGTDYTFAPEPMGHRSLRNVCVAWRARLDEQHAVAHLKRATNMTDVSAALSLLANTAGASHDEAFAAFHAKWGHEALLIDKWFAWQAQSTRGGALDDVAALARHRDFSLKNPNRARSLVSAFAMGNPLYFHDASGRGYAFLGEMVRSLDEFNPQIAARFLAPLTRWKHQDAPRQELMKSELRRVLEREGCSPDVYEIASKGLA